MTEFKLGDKVRAFGLDGEVVAINLGEEGVSYPIAVKFSESYRDRFTLDGKMYDCHKEPSLVLIERPKKKVKKTIERWVNVYNNRMVLHLTEDKANREAGRTRIACVKLTGEYEVEE